MADQQNPLDYGPKSLAGPLADVLTTPAATIPDREASGYMGNIGAVSMIASRFLKGLAQGRLHRTAIEEQKHQRYMQSLAMADQLLDQLNLAPDAKQQAKSLIAQQTLRTAGVELQKAMQENPEQKKNPFVKAISGLIEAVAGPPPKKAQAPEEDAMKELFAIIADPSNRIDTRVESLSRDAASEIDRLAKKLGREPTMVEALRDPKIASIMQRLSSMGGVSGLTAIPHLRTNEPINEELVGIFNAIKRYRNPPQFGAGGLQPTGQPTPKEPQPAPQGAAMGGLPPPPRAALAAPSAPPAGAPQAPPPPPAGVERRSIPGETDILDPDSIIRTYLQEHGYAPKPPKLKRTYFVSQDTGETVGWGYSSDDGRIYNDQMQEVGLPEGIVPQDRPGKALPEPEIRTVSGRVLKIDPRTGEIELLAVVPPQERPPRLADVADDVQREASRAEAWHNSNVANLMSKPGTPMYEWGAASSRMASYRAIGEAIAYNSKRPITEDQARALQGQAGVLIRRISDHYKQTLSKIANLVQERKFSAPRTGLLGMALSGDEEEGLDPVEVGMRSWKLFQGAYETLRELEPVNQEAITAERDLFRLAWKSAEPIFREKLASGKPLLSIDKVAKNSFFLFMNQYNRPPNIEEFADTLIKSNVAAFDKDGVYLPPDFILRLYLDQLQKVRGGE